MSTSYDYGGPSAGPHDPVYDMKEDTILIELVSTFLSESEEKLRKEDKIRRIRDEVDNHAFRINQLKEQISQRIQDGGYIVIRSILDNKPYLITRERGYVKVFPVTIIVPRKENVKTEEKTKE